MADYKITVTGPTEVGNFCKWCYKISARKGLFLPNRVGLTLDPSTEVVDPTSADGQADADVSKTTLTPGASGPSGYPKLASGRKVLHRSVPNGTRETTICFLVRKPCRSSDAFSVGLVYLNQRPSYWIALEFEAPDSTDHAEGEPPRTRRMKGPFASALPSFDGNRPADDGLAVATPPRRRKA